MTAVGPLRVMIAAVLSLVAGPALAEDLLQVHAEARARDPALRAAAALRDSARPRAAQAAAVLGPSLNVTASAGQSLSAAAGGSDVPTTVSSGGWNGEIQLRQPIFNRAAAADAAKARLGIGVAQAEYEVLEQDFILRVAQAYFDVLSAQEALDAAQAHRRSLAAQFDAARRRFEAGTGIITDVNDARAREDIAAAQEVTASGELRFRQLALARLVGRSGVMPAALAAPFTLLPLPPLPERAAGVSEHPAVRRMRLLAEAAGLDTERAAAGHLPTVDAVAGLGLARSSNGSGASTTGSTRTYSAGLELNLKLFDAHATRSRVAEAKLLEEQARQNLEATKESTAAAIEQAHAELLSAHARVKSLEVALASSRASLAGSELAFRAGVRLNLDVLNAQAQVYETQRDLSKARYDAILAHLKWLRATGTLSADDLRPVNALLQR